MEALAGRIHYSTCRISSSIISDHFLSRRFKKTRTFLRKPEQKKRKMMKTEDLFLFFSSTKAGIETGSFSRSGCWSGHWGEDGPLLNRYPSSHNHGSGKWVSRLSNIRFLSFRVIMGERVDGTAQHFFFWEGNGSLLKQRIKLGYS